MKMTVMIKGIVECTSDSRTHHMITLQEGIDGAIKIFDKDVLELDYADFYVKRDCNIGLSQLEGYKIENNKITITDKEICKKLLNHFKNSPGQLSEKEDLIIHIHVKHWKFFDDGDGCSDYIDIYLNRLEVSCQDDYDEDKRLEFHENIEELLGSDYAIAIDENLISLHINVTEKCQANCNTCYINKGLQRELEKEDWINLPVAKQYALGGGEPAEYPLISELVDFLKNERKGYVAITTNGQKIINFGQYLPDKIAISIDGLTQEEHSRIHNTNLKTAETIAETYKSTNHINMCINHIVHRENIDNIENFVESWIDKGYNINLILFKGEDDLKPTFEQLFKFEQYFDKIQDKRVLIDSCMSGLLDMLDNLSKTYTCQQGLYSKYYRFGIIAPCSHSTIPYPQCSIIEDYMIYFFKMLRPMVFIYNKDGTSGAHEWAFKAGYQGKIKHKIDRPLNKDSIYILLIDDEAEIAEQHYAVYFKNKMPVWIHEEKRS